MMRLIFLLLSMLLCQTLFAQVPRQIIYLVDNNCKLMYFNLDSCSYSTIAEISTGCDGNNQPTDIAFTPNSKLYGINRFNIVEIDTVTGEATPICSYLDPVFVMSTALVHLNDSILITDGYDSLFAVNLNDCTITSLGQTGIGLDGDLTWYAGNLYGIGAQILYKITLNSSYTAITSVTALNDLSNPCPVGWGLVTLQEDQNDGDIVMFGEAPWIISINPETLVFDTIGIPMPLRGVWGATSCIRYMDTDTTVTSLNNLENDLSSEIYPNPAVAGGEINVKVDRESIRQVNLYDNIGRKLYISYKSGATEITISLPPNISSGMYLLEIVSDKNIKRKKVVIK